jgi:tetratricopeptide (TPR) repeat protein
MNFIIHFKFNLLVCSSLLSVITQLHSQNISEKQTLLKAIDTTTIVENKLQLYTDLAWEYIMEESDSALIYSEKALQLAKNNNYKLGEAIALETNGLYYEIVDGNYNLASKYYFEGIDLCETYKLPYVASLYHSLGVMFHTSDNYEKAKE